MRFYALCSSNVQTKKRYEEFCYYSIEDVSRRIISVEFELLKFCLVSLTKV